MHNNYEIDIEMFACALEYCVITSEQMKTNQLKWNLK